MVRRGRNASFDDLQDNATNAKARLEEVAIAWPLTDAGLRKVLNSSKGFQAHSMAILESIQRWQRLTFEARPSQSTFINHPTG